MAVGILSASALAWCTATRRLATIHTVRHGDMLTRNNILKGLGGQPGPQEKVKMLFLGDVKNNISCTSGMVGLARHDLALPDIDSLLIWLEECLLPRF